MLYKNLGGVHMPDVLQVILVFAVTFALMGVILKLPDGKVDPNRKKRWWHW